MHNHLLAEVLAVVLLGCEAASADGPPLQWQKTFGGSTWDTGQCVQQTTDGGYIIAGERRDIYLAKSDLYLIRTDPNGNLLWEKTLARSDRPWPWSVQQTTDGGFILAGATISRTEGYWDMCLIKTDQNGYPYWETRFGGDEADGAKSVQQTTDGGYIIAGSTNSFADQDWGDVYLVRTDSSGHLLWERTFGGADWDDAYSVRQTTDGGFIVAGETMSYGEGQEDVYLVKTDTGGHLQWERTFGGLYVDEGFSVQQTSEGGYTVAGVTSTFGAGSFDAYLLKTDPNGVLQWQKTFGAGGSDIARSVQQTTDGGFIIAGGTSSSGAGPFDVYLIKTDPDGNLRWRETFGASADDSGHSVRQTTDGGYVIAGATSSFGAGHYDVYLMKVSAVECFEINQCFQDENQTDGRTQKYELIETKPFVTRVTLDSYPQVGSPEMKIKLGAFNAVSGKQVGATKEKTIKVKRTPPERLDFVFNDNETSGMTAGDYRFSLVAENGKRVELLEPDLVYGFKNSRTARMLVVPELYYSVNYLQHKGVWKPAYISFAEDVLPVPKTSATGVNRLEIVFLPPLTSFGSDWESFLRAMQTYLLSYNNTRPSAPADFICAVVQDGPLGSSAGITCGEAILIEAQSDAKYTLGHEIGHIYGLGEEYVVSRKTNASGLWVLNQRFRFGSNPPPLELTTSGSFIIDKGRRPYADQRCDWDDDISSYSAPFFGDLGGGVTGWWCRGRFVGKGGYDVTRQVEVSRNRFAMMSAGDPAWISGPEYGTLIDNLVPGGQTFRSDQRSSGEVPAFSGGEARVIVSGIINSDEGTAELSPLIPAPNLEPTPELGDSDFALSFLSKDLVVLGSFRFAPLESEYIGAQRPFAFIVDLPADTAVIRVNIRGAVAGQMRLTDNAPNVVVLSPNGGENVVGQLPISWSASDADEDRLRYDVEFSNDNGAQWQTIAIDINQSELIVDSNYLPGGPNCLVKVIATDGWNRSEDISNGSFSVATKPPHVAILDPEDGAILAGSADMQGRCIAYDPETGDVADPNAVVWSSNIDGPLGKGRLTGFELSLGDHILSATVTDGEGKISIATVSVTVVTNRLDFNHDRRIDFSDWAEFADRWEETCSEPSWCGGIDLNFSGQIEFGDIAIFCGDWLQGTIP